MKSYYYLTIYLLLSFTGNAQKLATFEETNNDVLSVSDEWFEPTLFADPPGIFSNPDQSGLNKSEKCFGAVNVADADWWGNFARLTLKSPVKITENNRYLTFMMYRSIQPKPVRIGFNGREEADAIFHGNAAKDATWEKISIDLYTTHAEQELKDLWFILSCNWFEPRSGWGQAAYFFDNFELSDEPANYEVTINMADTHQTIEGFAASDCWTGNFIGQWNNYPRDMAARFLFSKNFNSLGMPEGIGLSMWRVNLGAGTYEQGNASGIDDVSRRAECFINSEGNYNWEKQAGQQFFMNKAKEYGCEQFVAFSNSPPVYYTKNGLGFASNGTECNLRDDKFGDFADYLTTVVSHFNEQGFNFSYISPVNEPQYNWNGGQEGSPWRNSDIRKIATAIDQSISEKGLNTQILLTEAGSWEYLYKSSGRASKQINELFSPQSDNYIGNLENVAQTIAGHSYWTFNTNATIKQTRETVYNTAQEFGLDVAQTEWSLLDAAPSTETGFPESYDTASEMDIALFMAKIIQSDLTFANATSWSFWTAMDVERWGHKNRFFLLRATPADGAYGSITKSGSIVSTPNLWALGNFSLFVRPGALRIGMNGANNMNELFGSAYLAPDSSKIVAVFVNTSHSDIDFNIRFENTGRNVSTVKKYVTRRNSNLKQDNSIDETFSGKNATAPARSVTTFIYEFDTGNTSGTNTLQNNEYKIFPNPLRPGNSMIISSDKLSGKTKIKLLAMNGSEVFSSTKKFENNKNYTVPIPLHLPSGVYILSIENKQNSSFKKLIVN
ncbi:MAG: T9SS type A sorting domain-containing protein [Prolixibacteraceae bacterium]|jgi:O-glycosyl hydrolase|nr:T9SS type A sorting domain-containing protein [Prolixibacteraceae bacterium]